MVRHKTRGQVACERAEELTVCGRGKGRVNRWLKRRVGMDRLMGHSIKGQVDREAKSKGTGHRLPAREQQSQQLLKRKGWGDRLMVRHRIRGTG